MEYLIVEGNDILAALMANATGALVPAAIEQVTENLGNILATIERSKGTVLLLP
jgi:hypothetical protein